VPATKKVIQLSAYQPKTKSSPTPQNQVNFPLHGECGELAKSPVNAGSQGIPDTPPLANSVEPGDDAPGELNLKKNVLPAKAKVKVKAKSKAEAKASPVKTPGPDGYKIDCVKMQFAELTAAYSGEFNSWRGRKHHCNKPENKKAGWEWSPEWNSFKDFFLSMKPKPDPTYTLERTANLVPKYGPGLCVWAPPEVQNNNKTDNVQLIEPTSGKKWTPQQLAKLHNVSPNTIYKRIKSLWTIFELIGGKKSPALRDIYVKVDENYPKPQPKGPKKVHRPITQVPSLQKCLDLSPLDDDYYEETGVERVKNFNEICDEYDAAIDWADAFNAGADPMPPYPNLKYLKNLLVKMTPERVALRFTPIPPEPKPAPTHSYKHDPADCMPDDEDDHDDS
jgi:hypothetical protein